MQAVSLTESALLITSAFWQTNAVALRAGGEAVLIDSPYLPDELDALPSLLAGAGYEPDGLIATHGDFDHLLGRVAYPGMALGAESTASRFRAAPGEAQRQLRHYDQDFYIERTAPLALGQVQSLPVPGRLDLGNGPLDAIEIELHASEGHTTDGMASSPSARGAGRGRLRLVGRDPLDPRVDAGLPLDAAALRPLVEAADVIVPGHGPAHTSEIALRLIDEDEAYLDALEAGEEKPPLPSGRDSHAQRQIHRRIARRSARPSRALDHELALRSLDRLRRLLPVHHAARHGLGVAGVLGPSSRIAGIATRAWARPMWKLTPFVYISSSGSGVSAS